MGSPASRIRSNNPFCFSITPPQVFRCHSPTEDCHPIDLHFPQVTQPHDHCTHAPRITSAFSPLFASLVPHLPRSQPSHSLPTGISIFTCPSHVSGLSPPLFAFSGQLPTPQAFRSECSGCEQPLGAWLCPWPNSEKMSSQSLFPCGFTFLLKRQTMHPFLPCASGHIRSQPEALQHLITAPRTGSVAHEGLNTPPLPSSTPAFCPLPSSLLYPYRTSAFPKLFSPGHLASYCVPSTITLLSYTSLA